MNNKTLHHKKSLHVILNESTGSPIR